MPQMNGLQLADAIKRVARNPVIIATGFAEMEPETEPNLPKLPSRSLKPSLPRA